MPRHNYHRIAPLVKALCAKHGLTYEVKPFLTALADIVRWGSRWPPGPPAPHPEVLQGSGPPPPGPGIPAGDTGSRSLK